LHHYVPQRNARIIEHNHTLQIGIFSNRPVLLKNTEPRP
jgi:hypothetical protein